MQALQRTAAFIRNHPIARQNKLAAYYRFFNWQIRSRLQKDRLFVMPFVGTTKFLAKHRLTGITGSIYVGLQDCEEMGFLLHFLRPGDVFFDVGANVGAYSILASGVRNAITVAFEPNKNTCALFRQNMALNEIENLVQCENKAVGSKGGVLRFTTGGDTSNHVLSNDETTEAEEVPVVPLDQYEGHRPTMIKVDVEGFETEVMAGAEKILEQETLKALLLELNGSGGRYGFDENKLHRKLLGCGFQPFSYDAFSRKFTALPDHGAFNTIYLRDQAFVQDRVARSEKFKILNSFL